jgi:hypothetical protein
VSQKGVQAIAGEIIHLSKRVLSHCMNSVTEHLGKGDVLTNFLVDLITTF